MKTLIALSIALLSTSAMAQTNVDVKAEPKADSNSVSQASNTGGNLTIGSPLVVQNQAAIPTETKTKVEYSGTQTVKNVPSVSGPPLTSSNDTCMGSASGSANGPGFGISLGKTYVDENCKMLKNSRELWNMGMKAAALALLCKDTDNREALELTGFVCPQTEREKQAKSEQYTDPIVRARLGLPALK